MQIVIKSNGITRGAALAEYVGRRLRFALAHADDRVRRVAVSLVDVTDRRGEFGKCCRIQVMMEGVATVVIEDIETDIYRAIDRAASRAGRTVMRRLTRRSVAPDANPAHAASSASR